jgi:6-pyruvoyltetrahydropterin/6-carboxytetrahydropterin synthase
MKYIIDKSFDFCYGHRVWSQELDTRFTENGDNCLTCRHLHGHQGKVKVFLESKELIKGMVTDFKHLGWFKEFLDETLDHKFIMDINDPLLPYEIPNYIKNGELDFEKCYQKQEGFYTPDLTKLNINNRALIEKYEGMIFVDFIPTSENLTKWLFTIVEKKMKLLNINVIAVEYWETPKSHCRVEKDINN